MVHVAHIWDLVLEAKNVSVIVPADDSDHSDISSPNSTAELPECNSINNHLIEMTFQVVRQYSNIIHPQERLLLLTVSEVLVTWLSRTGIYCF